MNSKIKRLINQKRFALKRSYSPAAKKAIEYEINILLKLNEDISKYENEIKRLLEQNNKLEEAKTIAELVCVIHGLTPEAIRDYYHAGLEYTCKQYDFLLAENQSIVPTKLKKYFRK
ncbi:MAG: hypothetical protein GX361_08670 [Bacteroidales bacterium]|nr:hypothetical protein [Bacteroidales bacterium]